MAQDSFATVLCCVCSREIQTNPSNMCVACLRNEVDITEGINRSMVIHSCRSCGRFLCPPWQNVALESKELLAACMRKIPGLSKLRVVDAVWIWTEPHSMRLKIKITVQKEVMGGAILQQAAVVDFAIKNQQCKNCEASYAQGVWHGVVQVRQRVSHKRTFFLLEQILLKHHAHSECINIITYKDGMDFYFKERGQAIRFISFLESHVPFKSKHSRKLVSADQKSAIGDFKDNYFIELAPICKDDLVSLPKELARNCSDINPLVLVKTVSAGIHIIDPQTGERQEINCEKYWRYEFPALMNSRQLVPFVVLEVEPIVQEARQSAKKRGMGRRMQLAEVTVARESDLGANDTQFRIPSHLGHLLKAGDVVMGYDVTNATWAQETKAAGMVRGDIPEVILVRKNYTKKQKSQRRWELRKLDVDAAADYRPNMRDENMMEEDYETFLQEVEGDKEMRAHMNLYKKAAGDQSDKAGLVMNSKEAKRRAQEAAAAARQAELDAAQDTQMDAAKAEGESDWETDDDDGDDEAIRLDELLDNMDIQAEEHEANAAAAAVLTKEQAAGANEFDYHDSATGTFAEAYIDPDDYDFSATTTSGGKTKAKNGRKK